MVEAEGHDVAEASDGREGLLLANARSFDLILMDVSMPVMDGKAATRAIRSGEGPSHGAPIVGVTAHALPEELAAFRAAGMTEVLKKPLDRPQLRGLLGRTLHRGLRAGGGATVQPAASALPVLDTARLADLVTVGATGQLCDLLGRFLDQLQEVRDDLAGMEPCVDDMPPSDMDRRRLQTLHRCAGAAGTFGAMALHARLEAIETAATRGDCGPLANAPRDLPPLLDATAAAVRIWLDGRQAQAIRP